MFVPSLSYLHLHSFVLIFQTYDWLASIRRHSHQEKYKAKITHAGRDLLAAV